MSDDITSYLYQGDHRSCTQKSHRNFRALDRWRDPDSRTINPLW
jgi:hypothetical protein